MPRRIKADLKGVKHSFSMVFLIILLVSVHCTVPVAKNTNFSREYLLNSNVKFTLGGQKLQVWLNLVKFWLNLVKFGFAPFCPKLVDQERILTLSGPIHQLPQQNCTLRHDQIPS